MQFKVALIFKCNILLSSCFVRCVVIIRMSVGFIGAGQLAHALVKGFTAAGQNWVKMTNTNEL